MLPSNLPGNFQTCQQFYKCHCIVLILFAIKRAYFGTFEENLDNFQC